MTTSPPDDDPRRLQLLISQLCDQALEPDGAEELMGLLHGNADNLATYCELTSLHLDLGQELRAPIEVTATPFEKKSATAWWSRVSGRQASILAVAAAVLISLTAWMTNHAEEPDFTARITKKIDCNWGEDRWATSTPSILDVGREIDLERGLMVVEFANGAEVMLEAPVRFSILSGSSGRLDRGKLTADVGKRGRGFVVEMPGLEVVDHGTRFGASVDPSGTCEAHVFEGAVELRALNSPQEFEKWRLVRGEAVQVNAAERLSRRFDAQPQAFVHAERFVAPRPDHEETALSIAHRDEVELWFQASRHLQLDESGHVVAWGNLGPSNDRERRHGWQVDRESRPEYVWDGAKQRSALRFDGDDHFRIAPFVVQGDQSIVCSFRIREAAERVTIVDLGGPASLRLGRFGQSNSPIDQDVIAICTFDHDANLATLYLNGKSVHAWPADRFHSSASSKVIGATFAGNECFAGDLYELVVLSTILSPEQCRACSAEWMQNHHVKQLDVEPRILAHPDAPPAK